MIDFYILIVFEIYFMSICTHSICMLYKVSGQVSLSAVFMDLHTVNGYA